MDRETTAGRVHLISAITEPTVLPNRRRLNIVRNGRRRACALVGRQFHW